jgi:cytochrome c-type biogenesis protein CcsB
LGLATGEKFFSYRDIRSQSEVSSKLMGILNPRDGSTPDSKLATEARKLVGQLNQLENLTGAEAFAWIPVSGGGRWLHVEDAPQIYSDHGPDILLAYKAMQQAYRQGNTVEFQKQARSFRSHLESLGGQELYPSGRMKMELIYNYAHPFRWAWIVLLVSFALLLFPGTSCPRRPGPYCIAMSLFGTGILLQIFGFTLRTLISGRAPVTNMYEVLIFMALGASVIAYIYEIMYRQKVLVQAAAVVAAMTLILADNLPAVFDPSIQPLVPVLQSNWWLTVHVITITIGYGAFLLAMGVGHIAMARYLFYPTDRKVIENLTRFNYRTLQIGVLFLAAGTLLGGLWAEKAWGRFWGWDPKETWALIALLLYLAVLHARYVRWIGGFGLNAASVLAFQGIVMAGYGVNYLLGTGKHSYGFGVGGELIVGIFVLAELILVLLAVMRHRQGIKHSKGTQS